MTTKNKTSWLPQPMGFGYVTTFTGIKLTTDLGKVLTTDLGIALTTGGNKIVGKFPTKWSNTGA